MKKTKDLILLEQYLLGQLDEIQKNKIANRLKRDIPFAKQYQDLKELQNGIRFARLKNTFGVIQSWEDLVNGNKDNETDFERDVSNMIRIEKSKELLKTIKGFEKKASVNSNTIGILPNYWWRIAAGIILVIGVALFMMLPEMKSKSEQQAIAHFDKYPIIGNTRGGENNKIKEAAFENYLTENYEKAIPNFLQLSKSGDSLAVFYLGISQLGNYHPTAAIATFNKFNTQYYILKTPTYWYLGLCHLEMGDLDKASSYFKLVANANEFKKQEAITLKKWVENARKQRKKN